jgi:hypothetical protein
MNQHLSSEEISAWALGERPAEVEQHVHGCPACYAEITSLGETLAHFRSSVRLWSDRQFVPAVAEDWAPSGEHSRAFLRRLCWACLVLAVAFVSTFSVASRHNRRTAMELSPADAAMLERVHEEVSRVAPRPMDPLMSLVSWDGGSAAGATAPGGSRRGSRED